MHMNRNSLQKEWETTLLCSLKFKCKLVSDLFQTGMVT
jgi:hypothetical protein